MTDKQKHLGRTNNYINEVDDNLSHLSFAIDYMERNNPTTFKWWRRMNGMRLRHLASQMVRYAEHLETQTPRESRQETMMMSIS